MRGSNFGASFTPDSSVSISQSEVTYRGSSPGETWSGQNGDMSASKGDESAVAAGDNINVQADSDYDVRVVWQPGSGDQSATLGQDSGPDA
jgi:hypothetical protein